MLTRIISLSPLITFLLILTWGCNNASDNQESDKETGDFTHASFSANQQITLRPFPAELDEDFPSMTITPDLILLQGAYGDYALSVISRSDSSWMGSLVPRGTGPGEVIAFASFFPTNEENVFIGYDITVGQFVKVDLNAWQRNPTKYVAEMITRVDGYTKNMYSITPASGYKGYAGLSYNLDDARFYVFDMNNQITKRIGSLPSVPANWPTEREEGFPISLWARAHPGAMVTHPTNPWAAFVGKFKDEIIIYKDSTEYKRIVGPESHPFSMELQEDGEEFYVLPSDETHFCFGMQPIATEEYLLLPYSGSLYSEDIVFQELLVVSWEGELVKRITWNETINTVSLIASGEELEIFGIDPTTGQILSGEVLLP
ncbi:MAG TPA: hypothetical protein DCE41_00500 [Cytophagales bacterium]|nr:hypothetical protein [Cytophagales bacterium]HAA23918.1 hypothetical protein [Cytophagales bacterium]HAP61014.1 hypothetical protein [Cytophagales bacterium]